MLVKVESKREKRSILSGIHYREGGSALWINRSDAFSVLLTFSLSPKRRVVCQRVSVKLNQRGNNVNPPPPPTPRRDMPTGYQRRCLVLLEAGPAAPPQMQGGEASNGGTVNAAESSV